MQLLSLIFLLIELFLIKTCFGREKLFSKRKADKQPQQIHLSFGVEPSEMIVTWVTIDKVFEPFVLYGLDHLNNMAYGVSNKFTDGGPEKRKIYIHRATMTNLTSRARYTYLVGSSSGKSRNYSFYAPKNSSEFKPRFLIYGDLGLKNGRSIPRLTEEAKTGIYDAVLHIGDFAYDMHDDNGRVGDEFMKAIEPIAARVPYMTSVGNHESHYNFSHYSNRFTMMDQKTGKMNNHFYSYNIGPAHIISFSTEFYFFLEYGWKSIEYQYKWLMQDLIEANKPENRLKRPWIITFGHRPMYCSTNDTDDCTFRESIIRKGLPIVHTFGLEDLFYKYGVDLEVWAHEHVYERLWPVYDFKVYNGSEKNPYTDPKAPVHIITGSAGCSENLDPFLLNPQNWSAVRISDYGFTKMLIHNKTHLELEQISDETGKVVDTLMIIKNHHDLF